MGIVVPLCLCFYAKAFILSVELTRVSRLLAQRKVYLHYVKKHRQTDIRLLFLGVGMFIPILVNAVAMLAGAYAKHTRSTELHGICLVIR